ncbi:MAG: hypothetical protein ACREDO_10855 [Methyloceanibacter sp.]
MTGYRLARRFPVGHPRTAMAPVSREGWLVVFVLAAAMAVGAIVGVLLGLDGAPASGVAVFAAFGIVAGAVFIADALRKSDRQRLSPTTGRAQKSERSRPSDAET